MWNPKTQIITEAPSVTELSIHMKGSVQGWTSTKAARAYLPHVAVLSGRSLKVSPWLHLHLNSGTRRTDGCLASRKFTRPRKLRNNTCFFFCAVMMTAGQPARNAKKRRGFTPALCSAVHVVTPLIHFNTVASIKLHSWQNPSNDTSVAINSHSASLRSKSRWRKPSF